MNIGKHCYRTLKHLVNDASHLLDRHSDNAAARLANAQSECKEVLIGQTERKETYECKEVRIGTIL